MPRSTAVEAYWNFFESFNTRDACQFASALNYPHVRMTWHLPPTVFRDVEAYALRQNWDTLLARGWNHSEGLEPETLHESAEKVHIAGGWQRVDAEGNVILPNRVCYIVTRVDDVWGIQCRFGTDSGTLSKELQPDRRDAGLRLAGTCLQAVQNQDEEALSAVCTDDYHEIGVSELFTFRTRNTHPNLSRNPVISVIQDVPRSASVSVTSDLGGALLYLTHDQEWTIKAASWI